MFWCGEKSIPRELKNFTKIPSDCSFKVWLTRIKNPDRWVKILVHLHRGLGMSMQASPCSQTTHPFVGARADGWQEKLSSWLLSAR